MAKRVLLVLMLVAIGASLLAAEGENFLLSVPPALKLGLALSIDAATLLSNASDPAALTEAAATTLLFAVPASFLLANVIAKEAAGVKLWRTVSLFVDAGVALLAAGAGLWIIGSDIVNPQGGEDWAPVIGGIVIAVSLPIGADALIDTIPLPLEGSGR